MWNGREEVEEEEEEEEEEGQSMSRDGNNMKHMISMRA